MGSETIITTAWVLEFQHHYHHHHHHFKIDIRLPEKWHTMKFPDLILPDTQLNNILLKCGKGNVKC